MTSIAMMLNDPKPATYGSEPRNNQSELRDTNSTQDNSETPAQSEVNERTDYSYDPDEEWIDMHLDKKMEENY